MFKIIPSAGAAVSANLFAGVVLLASPGVAAADDINPFDNTQPSLVITEAAELVGIFPSQGGTTATAAGGTQGFIYDFAGGFAPKGSAPTNGQLLSISQNVAVFALLGNTYGGNGIVNFALPNLQGQAIIGSSSSVPLGVPTGSQSVTLSPAQIPPGGNQPFNNVQPSLPLTPLIAITNTPQTGGAEFLGQIANFAGNFVPDGWAAANGNLLLISQNQSLFNVIGTKYGGDGVTTFALPNLQGTVAVGADSAHPVGTTFGQQSTVVNTAQLPPGGAPVNNDQPSLSLSYLIAVEGVFPTDPNNGGGGGFSGAPLLGQIVEFAGDVAPTGWDFANGQLLQIDQNFSLFALIGTTYGGDGITTFALPDFDGRTAIGSGVFAGEVFQVGQILGADQVTLTGDVTSTATPLPTTLPLFAGGLGFVGYLAKRRKKNAASALTAA